VSWRARSTAVCGRAPRRPQQRNKPQIRGLPQNRARSTFASFDRLAKTVFGRGAASSRTDSAPSENRKPFVQPIKTRIGARPVLGCIALAACNIAWLRLWSSAELALQVEKHSLPCAGTSLLSFGQGASMPFGAGRGSDPTGNSACRAAPPGWDSGWPPEFRRGHESRTGRRRGVMPRRNQRRNLRRNLLILLLLSGGIRGGIRGGNCSPSSSFSGSSSSSSTEELEKESQEETANIFIM
jgi:hypothetical protein